MRTTLAEIRTFPFNELAGAAAQAAAARIGQIISHIWATDPAVQQLVGLPPGSTPAEMAAAEPRVRTWAAGMFTKLQAELEFLPSGEPFDVAMFLKALRYVPDSTEQKPPLFVPVKALVDAQGKIIKT